MATVKFVGPIFPSCVSIGNATSPRLQWQNDDRFHDKAVDFLIAVNENTVTVECAVDPYQPKDTEILFSIAYDLANAYVDTYGFAHGIGFTVVLDKFINPNGSVSSIMTHSTDFASIVTAYKLGDLESEELLKTMMCDHAIRARLRDLMLSISTPHVSIVNCARVVEGLRRIMFPMPERQSKNEQKRFDTDSWARFQAELQLSEEYIRLTTDISPNYRHGGGGHVPGATTTEILKRCWVIMNRFLEHRKRGSGTLPIEQFPVL